MKYMTLALSISLLFSQELEVEGNLKVTGEIDAQGNPITNLGNPVNATDAVNMQTMQSLAGMKPERIYRFLNEPDNSFSLTVPSGKIWNVIGMNINGNDHSPMFINGFSSSLTKYRGGQHQIWLLPGDVISHDPYTQELILNIFEYPISGSGTDQGMDYIEP